MTLPTAKWRGVLVSKDMIPALDSLAASVGPRLTPIPGYGSYRDNDASGGTDNGSGHLDCYAGDGWTSAQRDQLVRNARQRGFMAFYRPKTWWSPIRKRWISATWGRHFHLILKDSADLSIGAKNQLTQWYQGSNGLAGFSAYGEWMYDPDPHDRTYLYQTWTEYVRKTGTELSNDTTTKDWFDMATESDLRSVVRAELMRPEFLAEVARFVLTGYAFDHDNDPDTPKGVLAYALQDLPDEVWEQTPGENPNPLWAHVLNANIVATAAARGVEAIQSDVAAIKQKLGA